jgi:hypothetical protein
MDDRFEATFGVEVSPDDAWAALTGAVPTGPGALEPAPGRKWMPAFEAYGEVLEIVPGRVLRVRKETQPCKDTEIAVILEATETGTQVTVVQSGFGAFFEAALEALTIGWEEIVADLALFLERGVRAARHLSPWAAIGCDVSRAAPGLVVGRAYPSGFAERAGLQSGDILVRVGGAPVSNRRQLETLLRLFRTGEDLEVTFVRGRELCTARAAL